MDPYSKPENLGKTYGPPIIGLDNKDTWKYLPEHFWSNLSWHNDGRMILSLCEDTFGKENITICTRPTNGRCVDGKMNWMEEHLPYYFTNEQFAIMGRKYHCAKPGSYLLDDMEKYCDAFTMAGGMGWLYARPWNVFHRLEPLKRLQGLLDLYKQVFLRPSTSLT
jgi:hypothetical protein